MRCKCSTADSFRSAWNEAETKGYELGGEHVGKLMIAWGGATNHILLSDEHYRRAERLRLLGEDGVADAMRRGRRHNQAALGVLRDEIPSRVQELRDSLNEQGQGDIEPFVEILRGTARDQIADTDMSLHDAEGTVQGLEDVIQAARRGADAACDRLLRASDDLIALRVEREQHNAAIQAAIIIGAALLIALAMFTCAPPRGPACSGPGYIAFVLLVCVAALLLLI